MPERPKGHDWKSCVPTKSGPRVRRPPEQSGGRRSERIERAHPSVSAKPKGGTRRQRGWNNFMLMKTETERCPRGRRGTTGNRVFRQNRDRGFESLSLRQPTLELRLASHPIQPTKLWEKRSWTP